MDAEYYFLLAVETIYDFFFSIWGEISVVVTVIVGLWVILWRGI